MKTISICIPVYNEGRNLSIAVEAVERLFREELSAYRLEIIVTDNCSTDDTWNVAVALGATRPYLKAFRFARNFGYQNSVFTGLCMASGDAAVELDADLEDPPHVITQFVRKWEEGHEVVCGVRTKRFAPWYMKILFSLFYRVLDRVSELKIPQNSGDFRLLDRKVLDVLKQLPERNLYLRGLISYLGFKTTTVAYERQPRVSGSSKFRFFQYIILALDAVTAFSKTPLRLIGIFGFVIFLSATVVASYFVYGRLRGEIAVQGFTTIAVLMLMLHGITLIFLGVLGEYLSRIFDDSKNRPRVVISEALHSDGFQKLL